MEYCSARRTMKKAERLERKETVTKIYLECKIKKIKSF